MSAGSEMPEIMHPAKIAGYRRRAGRLQRLALATAAQCYSCNSDSALLGRAHESSAAYITAAEIAVENIHRHQEAGDPRARHFSETLSVAFAIEAYASMRERRSRETRTCTAFDVQ